MTLLKSKISLPRLSRDLTRRSALIDRLNQGLSGDVTVVSAPAGYGKTTLLAAWAAQAPLPVAWLALDEKDDEAATFLNYVVAAIRTVYPEACPRTLALAQRSSLMMDDVVTSILVSEIDDLPQRFALVLDDFHYLAAPAIHELVEEMLRWPSPQMHLLILSRAEPPLTLGRLRAKGMLNELDVTDLRLTKEEAEGYVAQRLGRLEDPVAAILFQRAEGWITGLHLAALSLRRVQDPVAMAQLLAAENNQFIIDYLFQQVVGQQPPEVRDYLAKTAILDRLSPSLARAVIGLDGGVPTTLVEVERAGLFLVALDNSGEWFAYHTLFRDVLWRLLRETHTAAEIAELHFRAGDWFQQRGMIDEALHHAVAGGHTTLAARLVAERGPNYLNTEGWRTMARWLDDLPSETVEDNPMLLVAKAYVLTYQLKWDAVLPFLRAAEERLAAVQALPGTEETAAAEALLHWVYAYHWLGELEPEKTRDAARRAREILPSKYPLAASTFLHVLAVAMQWLGEFEAAEAMLNEALASLPANSANPQVLLGPLFGLATLYLAEGHLLRATQAAEILLHKAREIGAQNMMAWAYLALGAAAYYGNDMIRAIAYFNEGVRLRYSASALAGQQSLVGLALAHQVLGQNDEARGVLAIMRDYHRELANPMLNVEYRSLRARLALMDGDLALAKQWSGDKQVERGLALGWFVVPTVTNLRVRLAGDPSSDDLKDIVAQLDDLMAQVARRRQPTRHVELLALKAAALVAHEEKQQARAALAEAVAVAEPRGLIRPILDAGPALEALLEAQVRKQPSPFLARLLDAFRPGPAVAAFPPSELPHLTAREREVLLMLSQYKTDRVIADTLVISPLTVRTHINNLAEKLEVRGRRNIVDRARELALLP